MVDLKNMPKEEIERRRQRAHEGQLEVARVAAGEKPEALSPTMREAMDKAAEHGGKLERMPGGFWIYRGAKLNGGVPEWYVGTSTVQALVKRGAMEYSEHKESRGGRFPIAAQIVKKDPAS